MVDHKFTRCDLHACGKAGIGAAASDLGLPHLAAFTISIERLQAAVTGGTVRTYLADLIRQGWFEIVSPTTGRRLRSGSSLILVDKATVFCFPDEPTLLLGVGDLGRAFPICAALLRDRKLFVGLTATDWGFAERHLPLLDSVIEATNWIPGPATGPLQLVLGNSNFAHYAWNQLSALEELLKNELPDGIQMVATQQPLGPIHQIFPELARWPLTCTPDTGLQALNARGALFAPVGGSFITAALVRRLLTFAEARTSVQYEAIVAGLSGVNGPVLWMSVRTRNRTATNQHAMLATLGNSFLKAAPDGAIIIDGFSMANDVDSYPAYHRDEARDVLAEDEAAAQALRRALTAENSASRVHIAVGLKITDSILLSRHANIYFCHHGTVQHKIGWFTSVPGVVHCNIATLSNRPAAWVAAQSEVAIPPLYISSGIVRDAGLTDGAIAEYNHLLQHDNYTITDIPAAIAAFFAHAADANIVSTPKSIS